MTPDFQAQFTPVFEDLTEAQEQLARIMQRVPVLVRLDRLTKQKAIIALTRHTGDAGRVWVWTQADEWRQFPFGTALSRFETLPKGMRALHAPGFRGTTIVHADHGWYRHLRSTRKDSN